MTPTHTDSLDRVADRLHQAATWTSYGDDGRLRTQRAYRDELAEVMLP